MSVRSILGPALKTIASLPALDRIYERILPSKTIQISEKKFSFYCPNAMVKHRLETFFSKEPQTLQWIDSLEKNELFFDIGANIGLYSLYAGIRGLQVHCFEPDSLNFNLLNRNIHANGLCNKVTAYNLAISNINTISRLYLSQFISGASVHQVDSQLQQNKAFEQGIVILSLDHICELMGCKPNHLKIDVDGNERNILLGATETLKSKTLKTILIEIEEKQKEELISLITSSGFTLKEKHPLNETGTFFNYLFARP